MGGSNSPDAAEAGPKSLAINSHQKVYCLDDYSRQELELHLAANPDLDSNSKMIILYQQLWKHESKIADIIKEIQQVMDSVTPAVEQLESIVRKKEGKCKNKEEVLESANELFNQLDTVGRPPARQLELAIKRCLNMADRMFQDMRLIPEFYEDPYPESHPSQLNNKILHPDLIMQEVVKFIIKLYNCGNSGLDFSKKLLCLKIRLLEVKHWCMEDTCETKDISQENEETPKTCCCVKMLKYLKRKFHDLK